MLNDELKEDKKEGIGLSQIDSGKPKRKAAIINENEFIQIANGLQPMPRALCCLLYGTGARVGEVVRKIKPSDVIFGDDGYLKVVIITEKHKKNPLREVYIAPTRTYLISSILEWIKACPYDVLFPISRQRAWQITNKYFGTKTHSFRHSDCTRSGRKGLNQWEMMQRYGWSSISPSVSYVMASGEDSKKKI